MHKFWRWVDQKRRGGGDDCLPAGGRPLRHVRGLHRAGEGDSEKASSAPRQKRMVRWSPSSTMTVDVATNKGVKETKARNWNETEDAKMAGGEW